MLNRWTVYARAVDPADDEMDIELEATGEDETAVTQIVEATLTLYRYKNIRILGIEESQSPSASMEIPEYQQGCETWDRHSGGSPLPVRRPERPEVLFFTIAPVSKDD